MTESVITDDNDKVDVYNLEYWRQRIITAPDNSLYHSVYRCPISWWRRITYRHRCILERTVKHYDRVLDAGCGYGRLIDLMPKHWSGDYLGVDLSPDFINLARKSYPKHSFIVGNLSKLDMLENHQMDIGILISVRPLIKGNLGDDEWQRVEAELKRVCKKLLYLEYKLDDEGSIE